MVKKGSFLGPTVVEDIPPKFGVFMSRPWTSKLKGSLQMDMSYATIPMVGGDKRLYNEKISPYVVSSQEKLDNHVFYVVDTDLGSSIFFNDGLPYDPKIHVSIEVKEEGEFARDKRLWKRNRKKRVSGPCILMDLWVKLVLVLVYILSLLLGILRLCHIS